MSEFKYIESNKVTKAQKRRDAKLAKKVKQLKRIEEAEKLDEHKERRLEQETLDRLLSAKQLRVHEIEADGDCLYRAVAHQMALIRDTVVDLTPRDVRRRTSDYMMLNRYNFMPFLVSDNGGPMGEEEYDDYCDRVATTREWGGHLELQAIAQWSARPVHVYQADTEYPIIMAVSYETSGPPILLSFHKHLYHLGEHYNSLVPA